MPLIYAGIDEAGYGPLLGPLCVGMSVFAISSWDTDQFAAPDLWDVLGGAICREPADKLRRIPINDSKRLKLANSSAKRHPLTHLERGVLAFMLCQDDSDTCTELAECPTDDLAFLARAGVDCPEHPWYTGPATVFPCAHAPGQIAIARSTLAGELARTGVRVVDLSCRVIDESAFNRIVEHAGTKAAATEFALASHLRNVWEQWGGTGAGDHGAVRVVCDRQSGRADYTDLLSRALPGTRIVETHRSGGASRYEISGTGEDAAPRLMHVLFLTESEKQHLPVALASMLAKLTRETLMARLNTYFASRLPELKPTAGYRADGWRWLEDARSVISDHERAILIRRA